MADNKGAGDTPKKPQQPPPPPPPQISASPTEETTPTDPRPPPPPSPAVVVTGATPFISAPFFDQHHSQFEAVSGTNPKRPRFGVGQWKLLTSPPESSPSPTTHPNPNPQAHATTASSSDTASSPTQSPITSVPTTTSSQETSKLEGGGDQQQFQTHHQFRKGKYVSPVWKPNEMLWLARAWRVQYQGGGGGGSSSDSRIDQNPAAGGGDGAAAAPGRGKTRAEKDREVAEFLNRHGVNRDAKTAGTKWDNMLGEFRKVYEWERGGEREQVGKSYFRLSPYERKVYRLPASFDEEVFEELAQFMGPRMRTTGQSRVSPVFADDSGGIVRALPPPPPPYRDDDPSLLTARTKQLVMSSGVEASSYYVSRGGGGGGGGGGLFLGFEPSPLDVGSGPSASSALREMRRIGKIRMTWEESVSLWAEEGEHHRGRVRLQGSSFLNADELTFFDDSMVACTMEAFEDGALRGFSVDRFIPGQQVKVFGRRKSSSSSVSASSTASGFQERVQLPLPEPSLRTIPPWELQDPTEYYIGCLRVPPTTLPTLFELSWYLQEPPPEELRLPLRRDVYRDLPPGKELFFTTSHELLDSRSFTMDILSSIIRTNPSLTSSTATSRDSYIGLWDDCLNRIVSKFCSVEMVMIRKPSVATAEVALQDQWPNLTGFVRNFCLWRGEETDQVREGQLDPSSSIIEKLMWTYMDLPYILGYFAVGHTVTFCALSRSQDARVVRTDLYKLDLSSQADRLKALVPCYRVAGLLSLLADRCFDNMNANVVNYKNSIFPYSDFERINLGNGNVVEMTPNMVTRFFSSKRKWIAVKEIYDFLDHRVPHAEFICRSSEKDLALVFKPRGCKSKPANCEQLVEALMYVTKALVALHDLSFMHRHLSWDKVMRRSDGEGEWFICGFDDATGAPQINPHGGSGGAGGGGEARGPHAPEMVGRGLHGVKVDVWGVGYLVKTCGLTSSGLPKMLRDLQSRCLDPNPEHRPTAADCYHHLLQLQSSLSAAGGGGTGGGY
ncbi:hypothetical protein EUGRSUZ_K00183 [Eucalyptus grandis]|uniref:Uncharacterized protein n=2 Tax=Eucalyptus grandis TaxID=71139 RepID=A0ACC3IQT5_EUCGR|nr:hypothetical protein EUGRSUZ_K00183 [Eucalyptus grandis]